MADEEPSVTVDGDGVRITPDDDDGPDDDGYVHRPSGEPPRQAAGGEEFGGHGWLLVGTVLVAFLVVPTAILLLPAARGVVASLGLTLRAAYLVLPLVPAFLLGAVAVWSALRARQS